MIQNNTADFNSSESMDLTDYDNQILSDNRLLTVRDLTVSFSTDDGTLKAADGISFHIDKGESIGLVGESGCGKSVTALSIPRLIPSPPGNIESGGIYFEGRNIMAMTSEQMKDIRGRSISMIFQEPLSALSPLHRIGRQLTETILLHQDMSKKEAWQFAEKWLHKVGIPDAPDRMFAYPFQLSGGMQQRIMIAMALMLSPQLIIADEPTTALDVTTQAQVFELIKAMKQKDTSMLLITHDMGVVWEMCERILVMYASQIVESGSREDIFSNPRHPYTIGLLKAIPRLTGGPMKLKDIPGQVPSPFDYPKGCHFEKRCEFSMAKCLKQSPQLYECGDRHHAACFLLAGNSG